MCGMVVGFRHLQEVREARTRLKDLINLMNCAPIMLRLAWQEAATYDAEAGTGGPNGSIRFPEVYSNPAYYGLKYAIDICEEVKSKYTSMITYADLYQLAGVAAGPIIPFLPGREDSTTPTPMFGSLVPMPTGDAAHLRTVFYRMGLSHRDIVVLSGGHTLGRAHRDRSSFEGPWTLNPLKFDNSYFLELLKGETEGLLKLPTDIALMSDPQFRRFVEFYARDEIEFFIDYALAHGKFSELGFTPHPVTVENMLNF